MDEEEYEDELDQFPWNLDNGDEVKWNDPDDGACSKTITIQTIVYLGKLGEDDCIIRLTGKDGSTLECFAEELS